MKKIIQERERRYKTFQDEMKPILYSKTTENLVYNNQLSQKSHIKQVNQQSHDSYFPNHRKQQNQAHYISLEYDFAIEYNMIKAKSEIYRRFNNANILMINDQITKILIQIQSESHLIKNSHGKVLEERSSKILNFYKELETMNQHMPEHNQINKKENLNEISFSSKFRQRIDENKTEFFQQSQTVINQTPKYLKDNDNVEIEQSFNEEISQLPKDISFQSSFNVKNTQNDKQELENPNVLQITLNKTDNQQQQQHTLKLKQNNKVIQKKVLTNILPSEQSYKKGNRKIEIEVNITKIHENNNTQLKKISKQIKYLSTGIKQIKQMKQKQLISNKSKQSQYGQMQAPKLMREKKEKSLNKNTHQIETSKSKEMKTISSKNNSPQIIKLQLKKPEPILKISRYSNSLEKNKVVPRINIHSRCSQQQILKYESQKLTPTHKLRTHQTNSREDNSLINKSTSHSSRYNPMVTKLQKKPVYQIAKKKLLSTRINHLEKN